MHGKPTKQSMNRNDDETVSGGEITNCYNTGIVSGNDNSEYVGGVAGQNSGTITNCYYLDTSASTGIGSGSGSGSATALTAQEMTGPDALDNMPGFAADLWTAGGLTAAYTGESERDNTQGVYNVTADLPQLSVFAESNGHETLTYTKEGMQQETNSEDGKTYYLIYSKEQLVTFGNIVNAKLTEDEANLYTPDSGANGKLMDDIVLNENFDQNLFEVDDNGNVTYNGGDIPTDFEQWTPIGSSSRQYTGTFDGNGFEISGLYINSDSDYQGLFGYIGEGGKVENLDIVNSFIKGSRYVGGVAGSNNDGTIKNCYNTGAVTGGDYVGGVAGSNRGTITNCYNIGSVICSCADGIGSFNFYYVGGVAGANLGTVENSYYLKSCGAADDEGIAVILEDIEDENGLLAKLKAGVAAGETDPWNNTLSAVGDWEYGKPAVQPVFSWQNVVENIPTYTVTIPEKAQVNGEAVSVSAEAGALRHDQTVMVRIDDNAVFTLYPDGDTTKTGVDYAVYAADSEASLAAGGIVLESGNTESGAPATVSLTFKTAEEPKYAGKYTDTVTFNISTGTTAGVVVDPGWDEEITVGF